MTFSTTTTFVNTGLGTEKSDRLEENDVFQYPVGIASTVVDEFQLVSKELDLKVLEQVTPYLDAINQKKKQIVGLGQIAAGPFEPGVFPPICGLYSDRSTIDNSISSDNEEIEGVQGGIGGGTTTPTVAYSVIRGDYVRIRRYPYMESRQAPNDNALEDEKFPILTSGNAGEGKENLYFPNGKYEEPDTGGLTYHVSDDEGTWSVTGFEGGAEGGDTIGRYYKVDPSEPANTELYIPGELTVGLVFQPEDLYTGVTSFLTGIQTGFWRRSASAGLGVTAYVEWNTVSGQVEILSGFLGLPALGGEFYAGEGVLAVDAGQACAGIAASQTALEQDIDALRVGLGTFFVSANTTKQRKHGSQLNLWSAERVKTRNLEEAQGINNNPRDIQTTIPTVESVDSELPTNSNTADKTAITADSTLLTSDSK